VARVWVWPASSARVPRRTAGCRRRPVPRVVRSWWRWAAGHGASGAARSAAGPCLPKAPKIGQCHRYSFPRRFVPPEVGIIVGLLPFPCGVSSSTRSGHIQNRDRRGDQGADIEPAPTAHDSGGHAKASDSPAWITDDLAFRQTSRTVRRGPGRKRSGRAQSILRNIGGDLSARSRSRSRGLASATQMVPSGAQARLSGLPGRLCAKTSRCPARVPRSHNRVRRYAPDVALPVGQIESAAGLGEVDVPIGVGDGVTGERHRMPGPKFTDAGGKASRRTRPGGPGARQTTGSIRGLPIAHGLPRNDPDHGLVRTNGGAMVRLRH
jgi:hypothetical protein